MCHEIQNIQNIKAKAQKHFLSARRPQHVGRVCFIIPVGRRTHANPYSHRNDSRRSASL